MTINVQGPDGSNFAFPDGTPEDVITGAMAKHYGRAEDAAAPKPEAAPITTNDVVRAAATGVPVVGGVLNKLNAATAATVAPVVEPLMAPGPDDISRPGPSTQRIGDVPVPAPAPSWRERYDRSLAIQEGMDKRFQREHPYVDLAAKIAGGVGGTLPAMLAAPAAFGLTGPLPQMVTRGAASNAALGAVDAAVRGESPAAPAAVGAAVGAAAPVAARAVGKMVQGVRDWRNPPPVVPQNVERVAGSDIPLTTGQASGDVVTQAEEEIMRRGGRGASAEAVARQADEEAQRAVAQASENIGAMLDPTGASARTGPQAAGQLVQSELAAQEAARAAAEAAQVSRVAAEGDTLARNLGGGAAPVTPFDAAERTGAAVTRARDAKVAATREAYKARDAVPGTFDESVPRGMAEDIRTRLNAGENPIWVDPTNESTANKALKLIDETLGRNTGLLRNAVVPENPVPVNPTVAAAAAPAKAAEDETVAALRAKFGDDVANKYAEQSGIAAPAPANTPLSLLQFIAQKGGLKPNPEIEAIGLATSHREQIPGQKGFFSAVRKNGFDLDRMREAAEEAGYLRGEHGATSTPAQFLDAIEAELRGQKRFPEGFEGFKNRREATAVSARETAENEQVVAGLERDLADAGYGELGPEVRQRAVNLMREEALSADDAVETAFRQLEQEDAAGAAAKAAASDFPGDRPAASALPKEAAPVDLRAMDEARKRLVTMFTDAKSAAIRSGDKSDMRAMGKILNEFDNVIADALESGKFTGDAKLARQLQEAARKSHAEYRQTFSSRGPGDTIGRKVEKILGRYSDDAATAEDIQKLSYGPSSAPGTGDAVKVGLRIRSILGENSPEFAQWKQGAFAYVDDASLSPAKRAARFDNFLQTSWAKAILTPQERASMQAYSRNLRATEPTSAAATELDKALARIAGADGHLPATPLEVADLLYSRTGKGDRGISQRLAAHLKTNLTPESWTAVRQGMWEKLTNAGEGMTPFGPQSLSQRLHGFLNENGKGLAEILFTKAERAEMAKLASVYKRMAPKPGTTNPSGSATIGAKIAKGALDNLGAMLGFGAGGIPGALTGHLVQKGGAALKDARAAKEATRLFFGAQPRRAAQSSRLPVLLAPAVPASQR